MDTTWRTSNSIIIKLNVGGQNFQTASTTLAQSEYFQQMLNGKISVMKDENGAYFIDRDPKYFEIILSFLRTSHWNIPSTVDRNILMQEMRFYMIKTILPPSVPTLAESDYSKPPTFGFWLDKRSHDHIFLYDGKLNITGVYPKNRPYQLTGNYLLSKRDPGDIRDQSIVGIFVNGYQDIICFYANRNPREPVTILATREACSSKPTSWPRSEKGVADTAGGEIKYRLEADSEKVIFFVPSKDKKQKERQIRCDYCVDPETEWIMAVCPELELKLYFWDWHIYTFKYYS